MKERKCLRVNYCPAQSTVTIKELLALLLIVLCIIGFFGVLQGAWL